MNAAIYKLEQGRARIGAVEGEARVVEQYRKVFIHKMIYHNKILI